MASAERTRAALLAAAFHEPPTFRMGFDSHVRAWRDHTRTAVFQTYHKVGDFARLYDAEAARRRSIARVAIGWAP